MSDVIVTVPEDTDTVLSVEEAGVTVLTGGSGSGGDFPLYVNIDGGDADNDLTADLGWDGGSSDGVHTPIS